jgi:hypothetical protein
MNNVEIDAFKADLMAHVERALRAERYPACRDCVYRALAASLLPASAVVVNTRAFAEQIADDAVERIKVIQGRLADSPSRNASEGRPNE